MGSAAIQDENDPDVMKRANLELKAQVEALRREVRLLQYRLNNAEAAGTGGGAEPFDSSDELLRLTMDSAVDYAIIITNIEGTIEGWSHGAELIFEYAKEEAVGQLAHIIFTPEDVANLVPEKEMANARIKGWAADERWHQRKDGSRFFMSGTMRPIMNPVLSGYVKVAREMTAQKLAEETLRISEERSRIALQSADMGAWDWDIINDTIVWTEKVYELLGIPVLSRQISLALFLNYIHADDRPSVARKLQLSREAQADFEAEFRVIRPDTGERWLRGFGRIVAVVDGTPARMAGVLFDITERKAFDQQKDNFIGIASHELKTPVTSIKAYAEVLAEMFADAGDMTSAGLMGKLDTQVDRLTGLIHALLDSTRVMEGQLHLQKEVFGVSELIHETAEIMQMTTGRHTLDMALSAGFDQVLADRERIRQVLVNLISNAIKYSPASNNIVITTNSDEANITIGIQDFGIGIDEELQKRVFERFFRVTDNSTVSFPGLGLGLFIAAEIIRLHGGRIWLESNYGEGATFYFCLPLYKAGQAEQT